MVVLVAPLTRPATAPLVDPNPVAAQAAPVAVDQVPLASQSASQPVLPPSPHSLENNVGRSRSSSMSSGFSATLHLEPHPGADTIANVMAYLSHL